MVVVTKSSRRIKFEVSVVALIVIFAIILVNNFVKLPFTIFAMAIATVIGLFILVWWLSEWYAKTFILELLEDNVKYTKGIIARKQIMIPLDKVINLRVDEKGILDRIFGECTISIDSAGTSDVEIVISEVRRDRAEEFNRELIARMNEISKEDKNKRGSHET